MRTILQTQPFFSFCNQLSWNLGQLSCDHNRSFLFSSQIKLNESFRKRFSLVLFVFFCNVVHILYLWEKNLFWCTPFTQFPFRPFEWSSIKSYHLLTSRIRFIFFFIFILSGNRFLWQMHFYFVHKMKMNFLNCILMYICTLKHSLTCSLIISDFTVS